MGNPLTHSATNIKGPFLGKNWDSLRSLREVALAHGQGVPPEELCRRSGLAPDTLRMLMTGDIFKALAAGASLGA